MLRALALVFLLAPAADEADVWKQLDDPRTPADKLKSLLGSDAAREDRELLYRASVTVPVP